LRFSISPVDKNFDLSRVKAEIKGFDFDLVITVGAQSREDLGRSLEDITGDLGGPDVLNIDNSERNQRFGNINVVRPEFESISLLVTNMIVKWGLNISSKTAEVLLRGISERKGI
jgi:nanoRNase/pAp phosphatase (c-di-AMP/oligoRNAs hydrolase)